MPKNVISWPGHEFAALATLEKFKELQEQSTFQDFQHLYLLL